MQQISKPLLLIVDDIEVNIDILVEALGEAEGLGIAGMRERAGLAGGELVITSRSGDGTRALFRVPLEVRQGMVA